MPSQLEMDEKSVDSVLLMSVPLTRCSHGQDPEIEAGGTKLREISIWRGGGSKHLEAAGVAHWLESA